MINQACPLICGSSDNSPPEAKQQKNTLESLLVKRTQTISGSFRPRQEPEVKPQFQKFGAFRACHLFLFRLCVGVSFIVGLSLLYLVLQFGVYILLFYFFLFFHELVMVFLKPCELFFAI